MYAMKFTRGFPADIWRINVIITSRRRFDVMMALWLRRAPAGFEILCFVSVI